MCEFVCQAFGGGGGHVFSVDTLKTGASDAHCEFVMDFLSGSQYDYTIMV